MTSKGTQSIARKGTNGPVTGHRGDPVQNVDPLPDSFFQNELGEWLDPGPSIPAIAVCPNEPACRFAGYDTEIILPYNHDGIFRSSCGLCGTETERYHLIPNEPEEESS